MNKQRERLRDFGADTALRMSASSKIDGGAPQEAIVNGTHGNPFSILGPHEINPGLWEINLMRPDARRARLIGWDDDLTLAECDRLHPDGLFTTRLQSAQRPLYRLQIEDDASAKNIFDAYAFGCVFSDTEIALAMHAGDARLYQILGAHRTIVEHVQGTVFTLWAPNAASVSVVGDFNGWDRRIHPMRLRLGVGVWELFIPKLAPEQHYKFALRGPDGQDLPWKADPLAFAAERPPATASLLQSSLSFSWKDADWIEQRSNRDPRQEPMTIYECHLGSWARVEQENNRPLSYAELGQRLIPYVKDLGFTHIELLPIGEFPFDGSWGYQPVSLFAPTSRFGKPQDFAEFVDAAHQAGLALILDWVPAHFPNDVHGLGNFDGTHLYEHADPRQGLHQDWGTYIYNLGRAEVASFLIANAHFWLNVYHLDGLRVDAVASMLYLDFSRKPGEWVPNCHGGNENLEAVDFLRRMNETAYKSAPGIITIAEDSSAWPGVCQPVNAGGLGFGFKWNMGFMHDSLRYMARDPLFRHYHHDDVTFGLLYAFSENFILPLSHDEVVHGKGSLVNKMPGDEWQKFANLRAYFGFIWGHPGKKLLFMGGEFAQLQEWNHDQSLDWHLLAEPNHRGMQSLIRDLNHAYRQIPALHEKDCDSSGFKWIVRDDRDNCVFVFARFGMHPGDVAIIISISHRFHMLTIESACHMPDIIGR
jgi:1,4-alpha-glucan branching enzyme